MSTRNKKLILSVFLSGLILVNLISNPKKIFSEYKAFPSYSKHKLQSIVSHDKVLGIGAYRWSNIDSDTVTVFTSKVYYNKLTLALNEFWDFTDFFSPRFYFLAGDGSKLVAQNTEPIPTILFPFWIIGVASLVQKKKYKIFMIIFINCTIAYLAGQKNLVYLWPTLFVYAYISIVGLGSLKGNKVKLTSYSLVTLYSLFIIGRVIIFTNG